VPLPGRSKLPILLTLLSAGLALAQPPVSIAPDTPPLVIQLSRPYTEGQLQVLLFDRAEGFEDFAGPIRVEIFPASGQQTLQIDNVPAGAYALLVIHDENGNDRLDRNFIGIPSEPVGFSNAYRPRGPPTFRNAQFAFDPLDNAPLEMELVRPLGDLGRIGAGIVLITRSSPYAKSSSNPVNILPGIVYIGNRLQITGPYAQIGLLGSGRTRLALSLAYRQATYEAADSPILEGMRDRETTAMAGLNLEADTIAGINFSAGFSLDALDRIGGGEASLSIARPIPWDRFRFTPTLNLNYILPRLTRHDYGVTDAEASPERPAYRPGSALNPEVGLNIFAEITPRITGAILTSVEWLDSSIRRSPIVDDSQVFKASAFVVYMF